MNSLRFYVVPRKTVEHIISMSPIPQDFLDKWEAHRPDVLNDNTQDIFSPNSRSQRQQWQKFHLFEQVQNPDDADFIVCQNWLELIEATYKSLEQRPIHLLIRFCLEEYKQPIVFSWNHDRDSATVNEFVNLPERCVILDYNTSNPHKNSLLVPFWNVETDPPRVKRKRYTAGFIGYVGKIPVRNTLKESLQNMPGYYWSERRVDEQEYLQHLSSYKFALCPRGGGLSSYRFYESIHCGAIPVLFGDDAVLPYDGLDYESFSLRIDERFAGSFSEIDKRLNEADLCGMREQLENVRPLFSLGGVQQAVFDRLREIV